MPVTITDPALLAELARSPSPIPVCDPAGRVIGTFTAAPPGVPPPGYAPPVSEDEVVRRQRQGPGGRPLADILARLAPGSCG